MLLNYRKDGTPFWNELWISPVRDGRGKVTHWVSVQADVTEQKETEQALLENYAAVIDEIVRAKPAASKGRYILSITLATTMGPGIRVDASRTREAEILGSGEVAEDEPAAAQAEAPVAEPATA